MKNLSDGEKDALFPAHTILAGYVGSIAHGTVLESDSPYFTDDIDLMGTCLAAPEVYLGLGKFEQKEVRYKGRFTKYDVITYELRKFFSLLLKGNPNVLELLWLTPHHYVTIAPAGQAILENRHLFVSKQAYHSFAGYASARTRCTTNAQATSRGGKR